VSDKSQIEWTDATWNPTTGCTKVSEGCRHCYIDRTPPFRMQGRSFGSEEIGASTGVMLHPDRLDQPLRWKRPRRVFVNSLSDLFHDDVPPEFIAHVFAIMQAAHNHQFQVLTKRPRRMQLLVNDITFQEQVDDLCARYSHYTADWPLPNVWLGTSVEDQKAADLRIPLLLETPAAVRFLSCEPLLGPVDLRHVHYDGIVEVDSLTGDHGLTRPLAGRSEKRVDWVIVGGESGPKARPMHPDWARFLRDQCLQAGVPFFFKQWGRFAPWISNQRSGGFGYVAFEDGTRMAVMGKKQSGRELDGRTWDEMPSVAVLT
jgi:protein gp37